MVEGFLIRFQKKLVSRIRELREEREIPQLELAKLVGVSRQYIYYLERGMYNPSTMISIKISKILGKTVEEIFFFEPVIKDLMGSKTLDELDEMAEAIEMSVEKFMNLRKIDEDKVSKMYTEDELIKISEVLGVEFEELFIKEED